MSELTKLPSKLQITYATFGLMDLHNARALFDLLDCSQATKSDYKARVKQVIEYLKEHELTDDKKLTKNCLINYKKSLAYNNKISVATKNKQLMTAKRFLQILYNASLIPFDATTDITGRQIKGFSQSKKHKKYGLKTSEVEAICQYLQSSSDTRLKAILSLLIYQGMRLIEISRLDIEDFDVKHMSLRVLGKGKDDKEAIRLHKQTTIALTDYIKASQLKTGAMFVSQSNNSAGKRLSKKSIYNLVKGLLNELNIDNACHGFRHHFITALIDNGFELMRVIKLSRHTSIDMMQVYYDEVNDIERADELLNSLDYQLV